ncbi:uncharacterized protein LOC141713834 [Apium graveolens]|uniref:uncharacterized protein LOC141713834 n=1 Tax=Apium graveolens TaxID=4045 RepID=UPI003D7B8E97
MQLQYPLLIPHGDIGYYREIPLNRLAKHSKRAVEVTESEDPDEKGLTPHLGGRLWQQYVVDAFTAIEQYRLDWIRDHQTTIRSDLYHNIRDAMQKEDRNPSNIGKAIIFPASFTGSKRYMTQYFKDSLAICRTLGHPSLFLTMTTNTKWPEIQRILKHMPGIDVADAPDVVTRVFKMKVDQLMDMIKKKNYFGRCIRVMHVIEFQKCGLPHAHILIWLHPDDRPKTTEQIDKIVSTEIPDLEIDPVGYNALSNYMIHEPCGPDYTKSPCMVKGNCIKHFPKRYNSHTFFDECGFPIYKRRMTGITINKKGVNLDNRFVVPFNRDLLVHFQCHMNLEICNNSRSLKYLFKYCLKGHDTATMCLRKTRTGTSATIPKKAPKDPIDEVKHYLDGRYLCTSEASWRIFAFDIHSRWPSVERLPRHLPGEKHVSFKAGDVLEDVCDKKCSISFEDLKTVNGHIHETFKKAYAALGLLQNDNQWHEAIAENSHTSLPPQLRAIFVNILAYSPISDPLRLWEANWQCMSDDILIFRRHMLNDPHLYLSDEDLKNYALVEIEKLCNDIGKSLKDYATMPFPSGVYFSNAVNRLLQEETSYDKEELKILHEKNHGMLNPEQKNVYDSIIQNVYNKVCGVFFVYGSGGCGKTFLWQILCCRLRSEGKIVLPVASCGIAAVLLLGGRTAYSRFHIPLKLDQDSIAGIRHGTDIAELIHQTDLIIWNEAPI